MNISKAVFSIMTCLLLMLPNSGFASDDKLEAYAAHMKQLKTVSGEALQSAIQDFEDLKADSPADAVTESLMKLYPDYAKAIEATDEDEGDSAQLLAALSENSDPYLAADATFYLARTLMNQERFESAIPLLKKLRGDMSDHSFQSPSAQYFTGVAHAGLLDNEAAISAFMEFLQFNPDAPERLRVSAWRQVQNLQAIKPGEMHDVHQRMDYSRRKLSLKQPTESTQEEQKKIVSLLTKLIKEQEKKEASSSSSKPNTKKQQQKQQQQQQQQQQGQNKPKPKQNKSQKGGSSNNANGQVVKKSYADVPTAAWSRLRDRSRDPANNAIKEKLPARYRDIVERYFEAANGDEKR